MDRPHHGGFGPQGAQGAPRGPMGPPGPPWDPTGAHGGGPKGPKGPKGPLGPLGPCWGVPVRAVYTGPPQQGDSNLGWVGGHQWGLSWRDRPPPAAARHPPPAGLPPFVSVQHRDLSLCNTGIVSVQHRNCLCFTESTLFLGRNWPKIKNWPKLVAVPPF